MGVRFVQSSPFRVDHAAPLWLAGTMAHGSVHRDRRNLSSDGQPPSADPATHHPIEGETGTCEPGVRGSVAAVAESHDANRAVVRSHPRRPGIRRRIRRKRSRIRSSDGLPLRPWMSMQLSLPPALPLTSWPPGLMTSSRSGRCASPAAARICLTSRNAEPIARIGALGRQGTKSGGDG
jgi:hypothetical protein